MSKTIAAINDLSGLGQSSLCAILPILSVMGHQACPVPTAVLSSQTDGYHNYAFRDLTDLWPQYFAHWQEEAPAFSCIYSGFLGSARQISLVRRFIELFSADALIVIDPVLGDNGRLYDTMTDEMVSLMRQLINHADIITPNYTELCLLNDTPYAPKAELETIKKQMCALSADGPEKIVTTSIPVKKGTLMTAVYERKNNSFFTVSHELLQAHYPGSGDIFAAVMIGSLLNDLSLEQSVKKAADFVCEAIKISLSQGRAFREGVVLEQVLPLLLRRTERNW